MVKQHAEEIFQFFIPNIISRIRFFYDVKISEVQLSHNNNTKNHIN